MADRSNNNKKMRDEEHNIQVAAVRWFAHFHPDYDGLLYAVPNGGARSKTTAAKLKAEGVRKGVADLCLAVRTTKYGALYVEFKTRTGRQSPEQKDWQKRAEMGGNRYEICRSVANFLTLVEEYLADTVKA